MSKRNILFLSILVAISSCTVEKRLYTKGFHVEFHRTFREADLSETNTIQPVTDRKSPQLLPSRSYDIARSVMAQVPKIEQVAIDQDSITDISILQEKEEGEITPVILSVQTNSKTKRAVSRIATQISIQTHFPESLVSKSLKKDRIKHSANRSRNFDWGEFWNWMLIIGITVGAVFLLSAMPGVTFLQALVVVLVTILGIFLLGLLIGAAFDNFEWFWSGR